MDEPRIIREQQRQRRASV
jgi:hypothetical protein